MRGIAIWLATGLVTLSLGMPRPAAQPTTQARATVQVPTARMENPQSTSLRPPPEVDTLRVDLGSRVPQDWHRADPDAFPLQPTRWRRRLPRRCRTQGGYRLFCGGERRVPEAHGEPAARAERLGLGHRWTAKLLMHGRPFDEWMQAVAHLDASPRLTFPVPGGRLGRGFGRTRTGSLANRRHNGIDIGAPEGTPIVAASDGLVAYSDNEITGFGNVVLLLHRDGYTTFYAHCVETLVQPGQFVRRGDTIARVGKTGFAVAPHLHFEWRQRGWVRDPARHLDR